jgi:hypothetical protein
MTVSLKHTFQSAKTDSADATLIQPSNWNQEHELTLATNKVLGRATAGTGAAEELSVGTALSVSGGTLAVTNVPVANGGTGATTLTGVVKGNGTSPMTAGTVDLASEVSGTLPVANGGTGAATLTANSVLIGNGTSAVTAVAPGTTGNVLSSNGTSWVSAPAETGAYTEYLNQSTDVTLVAANAGKIIIDPTVSIMVQLPDATTLAAGKTFTITNMSDQNNLFVKSNDGTYQAFVAAGQTVNVTAEDVSTAAGVWVADNPNYGFSSPVSFGYTGTYTQFSINSATAAISATKMIRINYSGNQTGLTATIITKSGAAITKGSEQFLVNWGLNTAAIGNGFINVVMTSATTGIITTLGPSNESVTKILLYTFSISGSDVVQITGLESFVANQTANQSAMSITMLSATSAVIVYHVNGDLFSRTITLSGGLITGFGAQTNIDPSYNHRTQFPQVVALSATLVVVGWFDPNSSGFYVTAGSVSGTTITWGTSVAGSAAGVTTDFYSISRLSATEFIVSHGRSTQIFSNYGSVSGTTITLGATDTYTGGTVLYSTMSYPISSTSALVVFYDGSGSNTPNAFVLTKSGTALTRGTVYTIATNPKPTASNPSPFSLKGFVAFNLIQQPATDLYMDYATIHRVFAVPLSVSGTVVTPGTGILVTPENIPITVGQTPAICTLSKTRAIAFVYYNSAPDGTPSSRLYLLDTSGARPVVLATNSTISTATVFCAGQLTATRALIAYATSSGVASTIRTLDITGDVFTFNASITGTSAIGPRPAICKLSLTKAMLYVAQTTTDHRIYNIAISGTTLTESPSYVATSDGAAQTNTSRRILYNYGDIGYFFRVDNTPQGRTLVFDVSGVSPADASVSQQNIGSTGLPTYTALSGAGTMIGLGAYSSVLSSSVVFSPIDGAIRSNGTVAPEFNGSGITLPFNANSIMICGNSANSYGKLVFTASSAGTSTNATVPNQMRLFNPSLAMHEPIQDWVDGDYFVPNTSKLLFMGRNLINLNYEMYHVFDKGAAQ